MQFQGVGLHAYAVESLHAICSKTLYSLLLSFWPTVDNKVAGCTLNANVLFLFADLFVIPTTSWLRTARAWNCEQQRLGFCIRKWCRWLLHRTPATAKGTVSLAMRNVAICSALHICCHLSYTAHLIVFPSVYWWWYDPQENMTSVTWCPTTLRSS